MSGHNLHNFTKYTGYDPDVNSNGTSNIDLGTDYYAYPRARTFTLRQCPANGDFYTDQCLYDFSSRYRTAMRNRLLMPVLLLAIVAGCNRTLDMTPKDTVPDSNGDHRRGSARAASRACITDCRARAATARTSSEVGDLAADNAYNSGTYTSYLEADR